MNPLPATYQKDAKAFWVRMEVQPEGSCTGFELDRVFGWVRLHGNSRAPIDCPYQVGDTLYFQEEWQLMEILYYSFDRLSVIVKYNDGHQESLIINREGFHYFHYKEKQPASTMPEWAARQRFTVTGVEAKLKMDFWDNDCYQTERWGWLVKLEDVT